MLDNTTNNTTTDLQTITVENLVDRLQKDWRNLITLYYLIDGDDHYERRTFPNGNKIDLCDLEGKKSKPLLIELLTNLFGSSSITSDVNLLDEIDYLNDKWDEINELTECEKGL